MDWADLKVRRYGQRGLGYADYFPERHKRKMLTLAGVTGSDAFFDLGCGDGSILIFAAKEFGVLCPSWFNHAGRSQTFDQIQEQSFSEGV